MKEIGKHVKFNCDPVTYESFIKNIFSQVSFKP